MSSKENNSIVQPLLTDLYQITMAYAYWKSGKINDVAVFDLFFRKNPFNGEFTIFAGLEECLKFLKAFHYSHSDIEYLKTSLPTIIEEEFYIYLSQLNTKDITVYSVPEGSLVFPRIPLLRIEGPLIIVQLLETTLLTLVNFASLMTTNAARYRIAAGKLKLFEFGLRRAQGPDGGLSASRYSYMGGFDGTSNVLAGKLFNIPTKGTHAHSYVTAFSQFSDLENTKLIHKGDGDAFDLLEIALKYRTELTPVFKVVGAEASDGELTAFISFAIAFPESFLALIDTYDVKKSGLINFCSVALALNDSGYRAVGIRLDSGDLAYLSNIARYYFKEIGKIYKIDWFENLLIIASNDVNEETILSLNEQGHSIDCFGIGTHLVTCQRQPALGGVYKMVTNVFLNILKIVSQLTQNLRFFNINLQVELNGQPRIKLSQDVGKITLPCRKDAFRLYGESGFALIDLLQQTSEKEPECNQKVLCRHPFEESKRAFVIPNRVEKLHRVYYKDGEIQEPLPVLEEIRRRVQESLKTLRPDIKRALNPTPYKVSLSNNLYNYLHELWMINAPIGELS